MKASLKAILLCVFLAVGFSSYVSAVELEGEIVVDTVWSKSLSPYILTDDVIIEEDVTLTIEPGVVVQFEKTGSSDGYHLEVRGTLQARGIENDPILFTIDDLEYNWGHIEFTSTSTPWESVNQTGCIMEYCILEYGGNGRVDARERAAIRIISASPLIQNNVIRYSKNDGIRSTAGDQNINTNRVHDTVCGIKVIDPESGSIFNNYLAHNEQAIYVESGDNDVQVTYNTILTASEEGHGAGIGVNLGFHDTLTSYAWEQLTGTKVSLSDMESTTPEFSAPDVPGPEALVFQVTVTDESGLQAVDTVQVSVSWDNAAPVANAGEDQTVDPGELVTLDGTGSFDNDDGILSYEWLQTSGPDVGLPPGSDPRFASFMAPTPTGDFGELLIFQMTVTDNGGLKNIDTVVVRVNSLSSVDADPTADAGPDQPIVMGTPVNVGDTVTLDGSSSDDTDGTIVSYQWEAIDDYIEFLDPPVSVLPTVRFVAPAPDDADSDGRTYEFMLTVTDNFGNSSTDNVIINVTDPGDPPNNRPTARAGDDQNGITEGTIVTLDGGNSEDIEDTTTALPNSDLTSYFWEQIAGSQYPQLMSVISEDSARTFTVPEVSGNDTFVFRLTVTDSGGLQHTDTTSVNITWTNDPPTAKAGSNQDVIAGDKVQLKGSESTDPDDGIENYTWTQIGGPAVDLSSSTSAKVWFVAPVVTTEEVLVFRLMVEDVNGLISNDVTHVTVSPATSGPTADAGTHAPVGFGDTVTLAGSATDPDGDIVSYLWEQIKKDDDPSVTLLNATTTGPQFTAPATADDPFITLTFKLTVTDAEDHVSIDTVLINVRDATQTNDAPIANAGPDQSASIFESITLNASRSYDPDTNPDITVSNNYLSYNTVFEETSDTDSTEEINPGNLVGISSDVDANSLLSFSTNFLLNVDGNFALYLFAWEQTDTQTLNLTDNWWGTTSNEEIANLIFDQTFDPGLPEVIFQASLAEVGAGANIDYPPIAEAGDDASNDPDETVTLSCSGFNNPNEIFTYAWLQKEGKTVALTNADQCVATFIAPEISDESEDADDDRTLIFELKVTDGMGFYDTDEVQITINEIDDDDSDTHSTSGCFVSTIRDK